MKAKYDQYGHQAFDGSGGFSWRRWVSMDDIFGQFGDILVVTLVVAEDLAAEAEVSVITKEVTYVLSKIAGRSCQRSREKR
jgi:DnaJ-class molecular chaperone